MFEKLKAPFEAKDIKWRAGSTNKDKTKALALAYIDARTVMDRLDDVLGEDGWQDKYSQLDNGTIVSSIGIHTGDGWIWKSDGAGMTNFEGEKGGMSDAFKRASVKWGIGRYLYKLEGKWVRCSSYGKSVKLEETPTLPAWALPKQPAWPKEFVDEALRVSPMTVRKHAENWLDNLKPKHPENIEPMMKIYIGHKDAGMDAKEAATQTLIDVVK